MGMLLRIPWQFCLVGKHFIDVFLHPHLLLLPPGAPIENHLQYLHFHPHSSGNSLFSNHYRFWISKIGISTFSSRSLFWVFIDRTKMYSFQIRLHSLQMFLCEMDHKNKFKKSWPLKINFFLKHLDQSFWPCILTVPHTYFDVSNFNNNLKKFSSVWETTILKSFPFPLPHNSQSPKIQKYNISSNIFQSPKFPFIITVNYFNLLKWKLPKLCCSKLFWWSRRMVWITSLAE